MDFAILYWIQDSVVSPFLDVLAPFVTRLGSGGLLWIALGVALMFNRRLRKWGIAMLVTLLIGWGFGEFVLKNLIMRPRPFVADPGLVTELVTSPQSFSFPSGHSLSAICAATVLLFAPIKKRWKALVFAVAVLIALSRLYLAVHFPTDVLAGTILGLVFGSIGGMTAKYAELFMERVAPQRIAASKKKRQQYDGINQIQGTVPLVEHPRPSFQRDSIVILNGAWECVFTSSVDARASWRNAAPPEEYDLSILVPYAPESPLSGVNRTLRHDELLWYRRVVDSADLPSGSHYILHFDAVDYACTVYCNGVKAGVHKGGYLPFSFDVTDALVEGENSIEVCVYDPGDHGTQVRGLQRDNARGIWLPAQSGIWKTVWIEAVPGNYLESVKVQPDLDNESIHFSVVPAQTGETLAIEVLDPDDNLVAQQVVRVSADRVSSLELDIHVPHPQAWSPEQPALYSLRYTYGRDVIESYCTFRSFEKREDEQGNMRFFLNGRPYFVRGLVDYGFNENGFMTPASDWELTYGIKEARKLGCNTIKLTGKIESDRWYYHCDRLGVLVWQDMVEGGVKPRKGPAIVKPLFSRYTRAHYSDEVDAHINKLGAGDESYRIEWRNTCEEAVSYLQKYHCIVVWALFNEGRGQFDSSKMCERVRELDPSRLVQGSSLWFDQGCSDIQSCFGRYDRSFGRVTDRRSKIVEGVKLPSRFVPSHGSGGTHLGSARWDSYEQWREDLGELFVKLNALEQCGYAGFIAMRLFDTPSDVSGLLTFGRHFNKVSMRYGIEPPSVQGHSFNSRM